jgi:hypothetical protein
MKQYEAVILTLERLGGQATRGELDFEVMKIKECEWKTKTPFASIRRIVQERPEIFKVRPGLWALRTYKERLSLSEYDPKKPLNEVEAKKSHSYFQGLLAQIGNLRKYATFIPNQDKNKMCGNRPLADIRTLKAVPIFSYDRFVKKIASVDVIWFNKRNMPSHLFEVEHATDFQNSLLKFAELQDFNLQMVVVSNEIRKHEFEQKLHLEAISEIAKRVHFLGYEVLARQYEEEVFKSLQSFVV